MIVVLDSSVLGVLATPNNSSELENETGFTEVYYCTEWFYKLLAKTYRIIIPDICDYELRCELLRIGSQGVEKLNALRAVLDCHAVTFDVLDKAAEIWSESRAMSQPNTVRENIDVDCIVAAYCYILQQNHPGQRIVLATKNIKDFQRTTECAIWQDII
ncbi:MAG: hypothetical protein AAGG51_19375 [Cyanobacteria bacterium P01_G01_bin.54]